MGNGSTGLAYLAPHRRRSAPRVTPKGAVAAMRNANDEVSRSRVGHTIRCLPMKVGRESSREDERVVTCTAVRHPVCWPV
jgi:hypothetical protein